MIQITHDLAIDEEELQEEFAHATGPDGQNVNSDANQLFLRPPPARRQV